MELCKQQRVRPLPVICVTLPHTLDFTTDRVKMDDWGPILNSLSLDRSLKTVSVRSRYQCRKPLEEINSEDKARSMGKAPVVLSRYLLEWLSHSVAQCVRNSPALTSLELEGVPLPVDCLAALCVGLAGTVTLRHLSLQRCYIGDDSCELVCRTVADVQSIRSLNLSQCDLSRNCGPALAAALSRQKLSLYHDTWKQSLRYREPNLEAMPGLRRLTLNGNPRLGDEAVGDLIEAIRDSLWLKALDLQHCGLTDLVGQDIIQLLEHNKTLTVVDVRSNVNMSEDIVDEIFRALEANCATSGGGRSEYRWLSLPQKDRRNVVSAGARRRNRHEESVDDILAARPKSAFIPKSKKPFITGPAKRTPAVNVIVPKTRSKTALTNLPGAKVALAEENDKKLLAGEELPKAQPRPTLYLDLQSRIDSAVQTTIPQPQESEPDEPVANFQDDGSINDNSFSIAKLNRVIQQLSEARMEKDRIQEERRRTDELLAEEKVLREAAESKLRSMKRDLADLETALRDKERETRGFLLVSQRSLDDIATSFEGLLEMLDGVSRDTRTRRYENCVEDDDEDKYSMARADIRRQVAHLIRKTKSESHGRGLRVVCEESSVIEASGADAAKKFAKSEGDVRSTLPPLVQPIRLERNIGDSPDVFSSRTRRALESHRDAIEDQNKITAPSPCERARAIFARIVNGEAILNLGAHGS